MLKQLKLFVQVLAISLPLYASNLVLFEPSAPIKAVDINSNFNYIRNILQGRNIPMSFRSFHSGTVIRSQEFEEEFDKLRDLNISIAPLDLLQIKSAELNNAFSQMESGSLIVDDIPSSSNFSFAVDEDSQYLGTVPFNNQTGTSSLEIVSPPSKGTILVGLGGNFSFIPQSNQNGTDSFTFRINDGNSLSSVSTATITINAVNDIPIANAQSVSSDEDVALNIILSGSDIEGSFLTYEIVSQPTSGVLSGTGISRIYTPTSNYNGPDSFTFKVNDGSLDSTTKTVSITVNPINDIPIANAQSLSTDEDTALSVTLTGTDQEGSLLTYSVVSPPTSGVLTGTGASRIYIPNSNFNGSDSFTFKVNDGSLDSVEKTISITINPINDIPVAIAQSGLTLLESGSLNITLAGTDIENSALTYEVITPPSKATLSGSGNSRTYSPNSNMSGTDSFTFRVNDGQANSLVATIALTITAVWPTGTEPALNITSGNQTIAAGSVKNYSSINIATGATLTISGSNAITVIGSSGPIVINGSIIVDPGSTNASAPTITPTDSSFSLSYSPTRSLGGNGATGGRNPSRLPGAGGTSFQGRGGGGGGGSNDQGNSTSSPAIAGSSSPDDSSTGNGNNGFNGVSNNGGNGGTGAQNGGRGAFSSGRGGGGGGAGGYFGAHGLSLYIKTKQGITGTGSIILSGKNGFNGGNGGNAGGAGACGGGGGGGGAGGSGGNLWVVSPSVAGTINLVSAGGVGGSPGSGGGSGGGTCSTPALSGGAGSSGQDGVISILPYP